MKTKSLKKLLVIKEMFLAASWVGWTESLATLASAVLRRYDRGRRNWKWVL